MTHEDKGQGGRVTEVPCSLGRQQTDSQVNKIVLDSGNQYFKDRKESEANGIETCVTASYSPKVNARAQRINRPITNAIRTTLLQLRALASLWAECLYDVCDSRNGVVRVGAREHQRNC